MEIKTLTLPEYWKFLCDFLEGKVHQGKVIKLVSLGIWGVEWTYLVPNGVKTTDEYLDLLWDYEPLVQRWCSSKEDMIKTVHREKWDNCSAVAVRCIFNEENVIYQCASTFPKDHSGILNSVAELMHYHESDPFFGFRRPPCTFIEEFKTDDTGHIDQGRGNLETMRYNLSEDNYRVFYVEMEPEEYLKEEEKFLNHIDTGEYKDDFYIWGKGIDSFTPEWKEFLKNNIKREFKDD